MVKVRTILLGMFFTAAVVLSLSVPVQAGTTIQVSEVDGGGVEISTPWGDYVAIDEGAGIYWVGTYREYEHARAIGILKNDGLRVSTVQQPGSDVTFAQKASLRARVGTASLDSISPGIIFNSKTGDPDLRWVSVSWTGSAIPRCVFYAPSTKRIYYPSQIDTSQPPFTAESFVLPKTLLTKPIMLIYFEKGQKPAVLPIKSITKIDYALTSDTFGGTAPLGPDGLKRLKYLRILDPTLPTAPAPTPIPMRAPASFLSLGPRYTFNVGAYPWTCTDPNTNLSVTVNQGDAFMLNADPRIHGTRQYSSTYGITIRPSANESPGVNQMCVVDAATLDRMTGMMPSTPSLRNTAPAKVAAASPSPTAATTPSNVATNAIHMNHVSVRTPSGVTLDLEVADTPRLWQVGFGSGPPPEPGHGSCLSFPMTRLSASP